MTDRKLPSEVPSLQLVTDDTGEVVEAKPANRFSDLIYSGASVLDLPPLGWIVPKWLPTNSIAAIYSEPGIGKSTYALSMALELASGGRWCGHKVEAVSVLYVAAEKATITRDRLEAWTKHTGQEIPANFYTLKAAPQLRDFAHTGDLAEVIREKQVRIVVIDTYARVTSGVDENSAKDTGEVMQRLSTLVEATNGGSVVVVHHTGKARDRGLRGSTAFLGAVDVTVLIDKVSEGLIRASVEKSNAAKTPYPEHYRFEPIQLDPVAGDLFREAPVLIPEKFEAVRTDLDNSLLELITESPGMRQSEIIEHSERSKKAVQDALQRLEARGRIEARREGRSVFYYPASPQGE